MKDEPEVAEGVRTARSATNGGSDKLDMRSLDDHQNHRNGVAEVAADINALPVGGTLLAEAANTNGDVDRNKNGLLPKNGDKNFECSICKRSFGYKHVLQNHERTHTGEKPFECPECHKRFTRDHHLKTHMRLHTGEKPYQCPHCDRHFVQVANLRRHLRVHTGERPYACENCESRFSDSNQLKAHMLIHRGEKPFQCQDCLGRYRRRHHLIHHKCPKSESNLGKPRRGRRPKAYEQMPSDHEDNEEDQDDELLAMSDSEENIADSHNSSSEAEQPSPEANLHPLDSATMNNNNNHLNNNHNHHHHDELSNHTPIVVVSSNNHNNTNGHITNGGGKRKLGRTISILTPQQRELFLRDKVSMQTQAIDMSLSPSAVDVQPVTVIVPNRYLSTVDGVLDLSSSRSDSELDLIEEDVRHEDDSKDRVKKFIENGNGHLKNGDSLCKCSFDYKHFLHRAEHILECPDCHHRRPLSQRIECQRSKLLGIASVMQPINGNRTGRNVHHSDDSNESEPHTNGIKHEWRESDEDSTMAIPLTTKKAHVATA